eukprot:GDKJ01032737.1.p1 GENE.GDKJ01032737.1~~GDKJ01032737.1.p1  ORF type:complete len:1590 (-),score=430.57 GDKJ01032737.1:125-4765(-)
MKSSSVFKYESSCTSIAVSPDCEAVISGHADGTIKLFKFGREEARDFAKLDFPAICLGWGADIIAAGLWKVKFFTESGKEAQSFDFSAESNTFKPFQTLSVNPTGDCVALGNYDKFINFSYKIGRKRGTCWERGTPVFISNYFFISALAWRPDGASLTIGSITGAVDVFEVAARKVRHRSGLFEMSHVSASQCIVKVLETGISHSIRAASGAELEKIDVVNENFIVARSKETFVIKDMTTGEVSEVLVGPTPASPAIGASALEIAASKERVFLDHPGFILIYTPGQIVVTAFGKDEPIGTVRTEFATADTTSIRVINQSSILGGRSGTIVACLQDPKTLQAFVVERNELLGRVAHDCPLDFLEISPIGDKIIFRDFRKHLYLYDLVTKTKTTFLSVCSYAQWVPDAEVVVAQSGNTLSVWYTVTAQNAENAFQIAVPDGAEVDIVEREPGKTSVVLRGVDGTITRIILDEALIAFREFSSKLDFAKAVELLAAAPNSPSIQASWRELANIALSKGALAAAEAALAHAGDNAGSRYVYKTRKLKEKKDKLGSDGLRDPEVQARLFILQKDYHSAEALLVNSGHAETAIAIYKELGRWQDVMRLSEKSSASQAASIRHQCIQENLENDHLDLAAEVYERDGQYLKAVELYLKSGLAARAASILANQPNVANASISQEVAAKLQSAGLHDKAGELFERQGNYPAALEAYRKGRVFRRALDLARQHNQHRVVDIMMEWAAWIRSQGDVEGACSRYVEAGAYSHAVEAALGARMWKKAEQLLEAHAPRGSESSPEDAVYNPLFAQLAEHYKSCKQAPLAAKWFIRAKMPVAAVQAFLDVHDFEKALNVARSCLNESEVKERFESLARTLENEENFSEAEKVWVAVDNVDAAIVMYKNRGMFDSMIPLVRKHFPDHLKDVLRNLAEMKAARGEYDQAERYYVDSGLWTEAVEMYKAENRWTDAIRVTQQHGRRHDSKKLYEARAMAILSTPLEEGGGVKAASQMLQDHGEFELCIDFLLSQKCYDEAVALARDRVSQRLLECYEQRAIWHEGEDRIRHAEEDFLLARKPDQAIEMYLHRQDYERALNLAERHDPHRKEQILAKRNAAFAAHEGPDAVPAYKKGLDDQKKLQESMRKEMKKNIENAMVNDDQRMMQQQSAPSGSSSEATARLDELVRNGQWNDCLDLAVAKAPELIGHYLTIYTKAAIKGHAHPRDAAEGIAKYVSMSPKGIDNADAVLKALGAAVLFGGLLESQEGPAAADALKKSIVKSVLVATGGSKSNSNGVLSMKELANRATTVMSGSSSSPHKNVLYRIACAAHYVAQLFITANAAEKAKAKGDNMIETQLRTALAWQGASLMRYSDMVSAEWVFYKAGDLSRKASAIASTKSQAAALQGLSFLAFNRSMDIKDAIENNEDFGRMIDDFNDHANDIPPPSQLRPSYHTGTSAQNNIPIIAPELVGEARDLVLLWAVAPSFEKEMPFRKCEGCANTKLFAASLECPSCKTRAEPCCVTGMPVIGSRSECPACRSPSNSADWEAFVNITRCCPWCFSDV